MSDDALPGSDAPAPPREPNSSRAHGGPRPAGFVAVASATPDAAPEAMDRLRRAGIAAHLEVARPAAGGVLFVDAADADDARIVLATLDDGIGPADALRRPLDPQAGGRSIDEEFAALVSGLDIDTTWSAGPGPSNGRAGRGGALLEPPGRPKRSGADDDAEAAAADDDAADAAAAADRAEAVSRRLRDERYEDPPELREEHYEPPAPPPIPRPGGLALAGLAVILAGIIVLAFGTSLGLGPDSTLPTGILAILGGAALLVARLKRHRDDSDDDGAVL